MDIALKSNFHGLRTHMAHFTQDLLMWILPLEIAAGGRALDNLLAYQCLGRCSGVDVCMDVCVCMSVCE